MNVLGGLLQTEGSLSRRLNAPQQVGPVGCTPATQLPLYFHPEGMSFMCSEINSGANQGMMCKEGKRLTFKSKY